MAFLVESSRQDPIQDWCHVSRASFHGKSPAALAWLQDTGIIEDTGQLFWGTAPCVFVTVHSQKELQIVSGTD